MLQGILAFSFNLNEKETGEIEPEFKPIQLVFSEKKYNETNYNELLVENDIFATFYQHTTGLFGVKYDYSNFYTGKLRETPYQIISYFKQVADGSQFLTISVFDLDDELELFEDIIKGMGSRLTDVFEKLAKARTSKNLEDITNINIRLKNELKFAMFQVDRLMSLDNLQKVALIYNSKLRIEILNMLRDFPKSRDYLKDKIQKIKPTANLDVLLRPLLELNLIRRDWIQGEVDDETGQIKNQGEYLFLIKDIMLARVPNETLLNHLEEQKSDVFELYQENVTDFFSKYDPFEEPIEDKQEIASMLLNPDVYDFFLLMRNNYYPKDKIPKIFSEFAVTEVLINNLKDLDILTEIKDKEGRDWFLLLTDIKPITIFPEYLLPKIREAYKFSINYQVAKKAYDLLELTYPEKVEF
ncbi:MAG: hypothetical protein EU543_04575 [Promethearchaeota archaeon]|nr:MAG: hypothetical protein EU543_04575 [Candidatus Lokiarchaeota archaeon]